MPEISVNLSHRERKTFSEFFRFSRLGLRNTALQLKIAQTPPKMDEMVYETVYRKVQKAVCCCEKENNRVVDSFTGKLSTYYITQRNAIAI